LLRRAGYEGRVVTGSNGFRRVRVGSYATDREAQAAIAALRRVVGGRPFVVRGQ
jgi:cell division protein FtsN